MVTIGITGPSGAGKGAVSNIMRQCGLYVIDADKVYNDIITPPSECLCEIASTFGNDIISSDGSLDKTKLSEKVFGAGCSDNLEALNRITHKYVVKKIRGIIACQCCLMPSACVIDAPLLIEAGLKSDCLFTIAVLADKEIRAQRISIRDNISRDRALARINAQKNDDFYIGECDYTIYNDDDIGSLQHKVIGLLKDRSIIL